MYLARLDVVNFRCLKKVAVDFRLGLNVVVGENNAGKSAVLDALRFILSLGTGRRDIYATEDDLHHDAAGNVASRTFELHATFRDLSLREQGAFSVCLAPSLGEGVAQVHMRFEFPEPGSGRRFRLVTWGGEQEGESVPADVFDGIRAVYLEALRNAEVGLRPGRGSRVSRLVQMLAANDVERDRLTGIIGTANAQVEADPLVQRARGAINSRLQGVTGEHLAQTADLRLSPADFRRITESLRVLVGRGQPFDIDENGLGYNNLLYIATVLGELQQAKAADVIDLPVLLVEEPEAHLHPHLQTVLVDYLQEVRAAQPAGDTGDEAPPEAPVQVFVTSHSPTLASRVVLDSLVVLYTDPVTAVVTAYPVVNCPLTFGEKNDLRRYLDVTKAQLFFARGILFVEGISEALLLPEFARLLGRPLEKHGVSVVNVQSLAFESFAKLFQEGALKLPATIVSDSDPRDPDTGEEAFPSEHVPTMMSATAQRIEQMRSGSLDVRLAAKTFEYDLALAGNAELMAAEYEKLRPRKGARMKAAVQAAASVHEQARALMQDFDLGDKARFAQMMAQRLSDDCAA